MITYFATLWFMRMQNFGSAMDLDKIVRVSYMYSLLPFYSIGCNTLCHLVNWHVIFYYLDIILGLPLAFSSLLDLNQLILFSEL